MANGTRQPSQAIRSGYDADAFDDAILQSFLATEQNHRGAESG